MKRIIYLLSCCILLTNCYSYKNVDLNNHKILVSKKYKIKTELDKIKGNIYKANNDSIFVMNKADKIGIPISNIENIGLRKFSYLKTSVAVVSTVFVSGIVLFFCCWEIEFENNIDFAN